MKVAFKSHLNSHWNSVEKTHPAENHSRLNYTPWYSPYGKRFLRSNHAHFISSIFHQCQSILFVMELAVGDFLSHKVFCLLRKMLLWNYFEILRLLNSYYAILLSLYLMWNATPKLYFIDSKENFLKRDFIVWRGLFSINYFICFWGFFLSEGIKSDLVGS